MKALSDNKQTTINLITSLAAFVINAGISFVLTPYILEKLGNEAYGFIGLAYDFVNYAGILTLALNSMSCRFVSYEYHRGNKEKADIYVNSILGANLILAGAITLCAVFMVWKLEYILTIPKALMFDVKLTFAIVFINYIFGICFSVFNSGTFVKNRMDLYYLRNLFSYVLKLVLTILIFTLFDVRIFFIALTTLICNAYMNVATYILMRKLLPDLKLNLRKFKWKTLSEVLRSGVWNSVQSLSDLMISGLNSLLTNRFIGTAAGGYLQSSKTIPNYILQLGQQLAQVFSPKFTILYAQGDYDRLVKEAKRSMRLVGFIISTPVAGFIVFGYQFYALWLKNYSPAELQIVQTVSVITTIPYLFSCVAFPLIQINTACNKVRTPVLVALGRRYCQYLSGVPPGQSRRPDPECTGLLHRRLYHSALRRIPALLCGQNTGPQPSVLLRHAVAQCAGHRRHRRGAVCCQGAVHLRQLGSLLHRHCPVRSSGICAGFLPVVQPRRVQRDRPHVSIKMKKKTA